ncbi:MAG: hypothetical protein RMJ98_03990, partial [Myxococcales bacterium]|nr:hypothetical protein [Myxococcales bacterium]
MSKKMMTLAFTGSLLGSLEVAQAQTISYDLCQPYANQPALHKSCRNYLYASLATSGELPSAQDVQVITIGFNQWWAKVDGEELATRFCESSRVGTHLQPTSPMTHKAINNAYKLVFGRDASEDESKYWRGIWSQQKQCYRDVVRQNVSWVKQDKVRLKSYLLDRAYQDSLGRVATDAEAQYWQGQLGQAPLPAGSGSCTEYPSVDADLVPALYGQAPSDKTRRVVGYRDLVCANAMWVLNGGEQELFIKRAIAAAKRPENHVPHWT